jgi:hypothetical protein
MKVGTKLKNGLGSYGSVTANAKDISAMSAGSGTSRNEKKAMSEWQPIETAPDHPVCLVWDDYFGMKCARFDPLRKQWVSDGPYDWEVGGKEIDLNPTHWMPLPAPPKRHG